MGLLNFSANIADAEAPPQLPAGEYKCICTAAVDKMAASSGQPDAHSHLASAAHRVPC